MKVTKVPEVQQYGMTERKRDGGWKGGRGQKEWNLLLLDVCDVQS
jgi:hypothetical protein